MAGTEHRLREESDTVAENIRRTVDAQPLLVQSRKNINSNLLHIFHLANLSSLFYLNVPHNFLNQKQKRYTQKRQQ